MYYELVYIIKSSRNCARCDWPVRVHYSSIKHAAYVTRVLYGVIMHAAYRLRAAPIFSQSVESSVKPRPQFSRALFFLLHARRTAKK